MRRRAFALLLDLMLATPSVASSGEAFRDALINRFYSDPSAEDARGAATAQWAAASMRDSLQDALSSIWHHFCRAGLAAQPFDGMTPAELREFVGEQLVDRVELDLGSGAIHTRQDDRLEEWVTRVIAAAAGRGWQELTARAEQADNALTGLATLVALVDRVPATDSVSPAWLEVAGVDGENQPGLLQMVTLLRRRIDEEATVGALMRWVIEAFIVAVHETVAMGKLPESTFRFSWEQGRLRFVDNGVWRFEASGLRRNALASIAADLGWWGPDQHDDAVVTAEGKQVVEGVFGP